MSQKAEVDGSNNIFVQIEGDRNQVNLKGLPHLTLTRYLTRRSIENDADILTPYSFSIPMIGREGDLAGLGAWLDSPKPISVRVLTGRAGAGKTRLALELIETRLNVGWDAGVVTSRELDRFFAQQNLRNWGWQRPTLVVIDYAASHAEAIYGWLAELSDQGGVDGKPLRLLLLERSANQEAGWWRTAFGYADGTAKAIQRLLDPVEPIALPPIDERERKRQIFQAALQRGQSGLNAPEAGEDAYFDYQLDNLTWGGEPLFLMMAGLLGAKHGVRHALALSRTDLAFDLAERELERIGRAGGDNASRVAFLRHMAAYITLCYGLSRTALEEAIEEERHATRRDAAGDAASLADLLIDLLPGGADEAAPILPDMIGEAACLLALGDGSDTILRAFERERTQVPGTVIRTAQDFAGQTEGGETITAPLAWLDRLIQREDIQLDQLNIISSQIINTIMKYNTSLVLMDANRLVIEAVVSRLQAIPAQDENIQSELARNKTNLAITLGELGRQKEGLIVAIEAVDLCYRLEIERPGCLQRGLSLSHNTLANRLAACGYDGAALRVAREVLRIDMLNAAVDPEAFRPDVAVSVQNLANRLFAVGQNKEAVAGARLAIRHYRDLTSDKPDEFQSYLGMSLCSASGMLSEIGSPDEGLIAANEAVELFKKLSVELPDAFSRYLAVSLEARADCLERLERKKEALASNIEAISTLKDSFLKHPPRHIRWMKPMLKKYIDRCRTLGETPDEELLGPIVEAIQAMEEME